MEKTSIFRNKDKQTLKNEQAALLTVIGPKNLLILLGIIIFLAAVIVFSVTVPINMTVLIEGTVAYGEGSIDIISDLEGTITQVAVSEDDYVQTGDILAVLTNEALASNFGSLLNEEQKSSVMRQTMIVAPENGVVNEIFFQEGEYISKNTVFSTISKQEENNRMGVFVATAAYDDIKSVKQGDEVYVELNTIPSDEYGYLKGVVRTLEKKKDAEDQVTIIIDPKVDENGDYLWTKENQGVERRLEIGVAGTATIFTNRLYLWDLIIS